MSLESNKYQNDVNYSSLDVAKFICALLVIVIHTRPLEQISATANFYLCDVFSRIAVPMFYAISGFLFFRKIVFENGRIKNCKENRRRLWHYLKRIFLIYAGWSAFYLIGQLPKWHTMGWWGLPMIKSNVVSFVFHYIYWHLWYLNAMLYAIPLVYLLLSLATKHIAVSVCIICSLCECLLHPYSWIGVDQLPIINWLASHFETPFYAVFRAGPLLIIGYLCTQYRDADKQRYFYGLGFSTVLWIVEASILYYFTPNKDQFVFLLTTPAFTYFALNYLLCTKYRDVRDKQIVVLRKSTLMIYCIHPMLIKIYKYYNFPAGIIKWLVVTLISISLSLGWGCWKRKF